MIEFYYRLNEKNACFFLLSMLFGDLHFDYPRFFFSYMRLLACSNNGQDKRLMDLHLRQDLCACTLFTTYTYKFINLCSAQLPLSVWLYSYR